MLTTWCVLVLLALLNPSQTANPGVKVRLTQKGLEYARQVGMAEVQRKLQTIRFPNLSGKSKGVKYKAWNVKITSIGLPKSAVGLVPGTGISLSISNGHISLRGNYRVRWHFIRKSGGFSLTASGLGITSHLAPRKDGAGRPTISSAKCVARVGNLRWRFHGGGRRLLNVFRRRVARAIRKTLSKKICPEVTDAIKELNPRLQTLNVHARVDKHAEIEYSMVANPVTTRDYINLDLKGQFYNIGNHKEPPFSAPPFSLKVDNNKMAYIGLSSFTLNSAGFVYNRAGILKYTITDDLIPPKSPIRLNTVTFGALVPQISKNFPNCLVKLLAKTSDPPSVTFEPGKMTLHVAGEITAYAIQGNGTLSPLFILKLDASVSAKAFITGDKLASSVNLEKINLALRKTYVGPFEVKGLEGIMLLALKLVVIPEVNGRLRDGIPLPALGKMDLVNPVLLIQQGYLMIGTDVRFRP